MSAYDLLSTVPDFTEPAEGHRAVNVAGETWYLPQGFGYDSYKGTWRIIVDGRPRWRTKLEDAWALYQEVREQDVPLGGMYQRSGVRDGIPKLDTGVKGVSAGVSRQGAYWRWTVEVQQQVNGRRAKVRVIQQRVDTLDQRGVDDVLAVATAIRRTHERHVEQGEATALVTVDTYDIDLLPTKPEVPLWLSEIWGVIHAKENQ